MGRAVPSSSSSLLLILPLLGLMGCARPAPDLPAPFTSASTPQTDAQARLDRCAALKSEIAVLRDEIRVVEEVIAGDRHEDQAAGYFAAVLFPPAMLLIDQKREQKNALDDRQARIDLKLAEQHALQCP